MRNTIIFPIFTALAFFLFTPGALADCILHVPKNCAYKSSNLSTSGDKSPGYVLEYDCQKTDGTIVKYMDWDFSITKYFGIGRFTVPRRTVFKEWDKDSVELDC